MCSVLKTKKVCQWGDKPFFKQVNELLSAMLRQHFQQPRHIRFFTNNRRYFANRHPLLLHRVALADGHGIVFQRFKVDGQAERRADGVLPAI